MKRTLKRKAKRNLKQEYKAKLKQIRKECNGDMNRYRLLKDGLRKMYGLPVLP